MKPDTVVEMTRRNALLSAGAIGLVGLGSQVLGAEKDSASGKQMPAARDLASNLKLSDQQYEEAKVILPPESVPVRLVEPKDRAQKSKDIEPEVIEILDGRRERLGFALQWICPANVINHLFLNGSPLVSEGLRFRFQTSVGKPGTVGRCIRPTVREVIITPACITSTQKCTKLFPRSLDRIISLDALAVPYVKAQIRDKSPLP